MDSTAEKNDAYADIKADGAAMTFSRNVQGTYNPATGVVTNTTLSYATYGLITEYTNFEIDGTLIKQGDKRIIIGIPAGMPEPLQDDNLILGGVTWAVKGVNAVMPSGTAIIYKLQVRK